MNNGQLQSYHDELATWNRIIAFHKAELRQALVQIGALLEMPAMSRSDSKDGNAFSDQLMVQEQQFDFITHQITSQRNRLEKTIPFESSIIAPPLTHQQDLIRSKIKAAERNFNNTKYNCSSYLSTFLSECVSAISV